MLAEFFAHHPHIHVELVYDDGFVDIVREGFDIGIRNGESLEGDMVAMPLTQDLTMSFGASPAYLQAHGVPQHPDELEHHQCINYRMSSSGAVYKWEFNIDGKLCERAVSGPLTVNHGDTAMRAALDGVGLITGWRESMRGAFHAGQLVEVLKPYWASFPGFYAYYPHRTHLPLKTRIFLDFLVHMCSETAFPMQRMDNGDPDFILVLWAARTMTPRPSAVCRASAASPHRTEARLRRLMLGNRQNAIHVQTLPTIMRPSLMTSSKQQGTPLLQAWPDGALYGSNTWAYAHLPNSHCPGAGRAEDAPAAPQRCASCWHCWRRQTDSRTSLTSSNTTLY